jgi:hypothetical protein
MAAYPGSAEVPAVVEARTIVVLSLEIQEGSYYKKYDAAIVVFSITIVPRLC